MRDWFDAQGFTRIQDFAILTDDDIEEMEYADSNGVMSKAPKSHRTRMKAAIAYYHYVDNYHDEYGTLDITSSSSFINERTFDKSLVTGYDP
jgi:hypothetical protein